MSNAEPRGNAASGGSHPAAEIGEGARILPAHETTRMGEAGESANTVMGLEAKLNATSADSFVGGKIGKYEIRALLGQGGMGAVYLAFDPLIEREVALKVLSQDVGNNSVALQRFLAEARAIGRLNSPHVVAIYDIDQWDGQYFLVMELLSGGSVAQLSEERGPLPWQVACQTVIEAARGLSCAHAVGMIHRDIKPENLMLTREGLVKVVDFGLSKLVDDAQDTRTAVTRAGQILGTPQYMSPEQFESADVDERTDIYSLGATLFRLLTGRFPYHDCRSIVQVMAAHINQPPPVATQYSANVPAACNVIIARAMAKKLADRYQTAAELAADLLSLLQLESPTSGATATEPVDELRDLASVLIIEPSKLQAAILKDAFSRAGTPSIQVLGRATEARQAVELKAPDVLITAMELPDDRGIELLRHFATKARLSRTTVVLNSSEATIEELVAIGPAACLILAPKRVKPDEVQRVIHAASSLAVHGSAILKTIDPQNVRLRIVLDSGSLPTAVADLVRKGQFLNVDVLSRDGAASGEGDPPDLTLLLHSDKSARRDGSVYATLALNSAGKLGTTAAIQVEQDNIWLRSVARHGIVAATQRPLDMERLKRLLQSCPR